jgi:D-alanyl-D-alanine carboxypeptidase/D-alanyl-D-alanine-endopeptidase (penicillin-binding protein 4)
MRDSAPALSAASVSRRGWLLGAGAAAAPAWALSKPPVDSGRRLPDAVRACLAASGLPLEQFGVQVQPVDGGAALVALNAEVPCVMASTAKTVTAMAALDLLGPSYRWRTRAYARGLMVEGHLYGDLILVGGGDVLLTTAALRDWFREMRLRGLHHVQAASCSTAARSGSANATSPARPNRRRTGRTTCARTP